MFERGHHGAAEFELDVVPGRPVTVDARHADRLLTGPVYTGVLAFAAVALLFLALEELLREAHERDERPVVTATLFMGLLAFLLLEQLVG